MVGSHQNAARASTVHVQAVEGPRYKVPGFPSQRRTFLYPTLFCRSSRIPHLAPRRPFDWRLRSHPRSTCHSLPLSIAGRSFARRRKRRSRCRSLDAEAHIASPPGRGRDREQTSRHTAIVRGDSHGRGHSRHTSLLFQLTTTGASKRGACQLC